MKTFLLCFATSLTLAGAAHATETKLTKDDLTAATKIVFDAYGKDKFDAVFKKVSAKLGPVQKDAPNMKSWFAKDADKCIQFWITSDHGNAATGMASDTEAAKTGCK